MLRLRHSFSALALATALVLPVASPSLAADAAKTWTKAELEALITETLMKHPEVIISSVEKMQEVKQKEEQEASRAAVSAYRTSLYQDEHSPSAGPKDADVTIVEFLDYNCGYCKQSLPNVAKMLETDKKVRFIFKEFPVIAPSSEIAARAALAVNAIDPEKYFDYHSALYKLGGKFDESTLKTLAESMGIDGEQFVKELNSEEVKARLDANLQLGTKLGNRGVPVFIIGDETFPGAIPFERLKTEVELYREKAAKKS